MKLSWNINLLERQDGIKKRSRSHFVNIHDDEFALLFLLLPYLLVNNLFVGIYCGKFLKL